MAGPKLLLSVPLCLALNLPDWCHWPFIILQEREALLQVVKQGIDRMSTPKIKHPSINFYNLSFFRVKYKRRKRKDRLAVVLLSLS